MKSQRLPFENRWTNGERAWQWHCELERLGVSTVRTMFAEHVTHQSRRQAVVYDIPPEFVRDWLAFHDRNEARRQRLWQLSFAAAAIIALAVATAALLRT
ncbi:hypothetical protein NB311A_10870 [Nitrobacter sp. Nb-311A]|uniref:hypothetical protein n=1 Tax=unclassified Nitrobacter TaxID=2620411 RepID=UPI0000685F2D|nr:MULTISPECIES: hypothetical protein [unclassified Nitrobacter]EAQ34957.1 hypothetical protein NB311A_10870 [Nitrobacter sp. Nb-311A]MCB1393466.1 hypothetical protein [Nitrobacter sp.]MCV0387173.1 hypothetical protein [Nitrobacter sp.]